MWQVARWGITAALLAGCSPDIHGDWTISTFWDAPLPYAFEDEGHDMEIVGVEMLVEDDTATLAVIVERVDTEELFPGTYLSDVVEDGDDWTLDFTDWYAEGLWACTLPTSDTLDCTDQDDASIVFDRF